MTRIEDRLGGIIVVHGVLVDYDLTPAAATEGFARSDTRFTKYPQKLWNGGKEGIVEVSIPILCPPSRFTTADGRYQQEALGYGLPAELAALKGNEVCDELWERGVLALVALLQNDDELWASPPILIVNPEYRSFRLIDRMAEWDDGHGLVGCPFLPDD